MENHSSPVCGPWRFLVRSSVLVASVLLAGSCTGVSDSALPADSSVATTTDTRPTAEYEAPTNSDEVAVQDSLNLSTVDLDPWAVSWPSDWTRGQTLGRGVVVFLGDPRSGGQDTLLIEAGSELGDDETVAMNEMLAVADSVGDAVSLGVPSATDHDSGGRWLRLAFNVEVDGEAQTAVMHKLVVGEAAISFVLVSDPESFATLAPIVEQLVAETSLAKE